MRGKLAWVDSKSGPESQAGLVAASARGADDPLPSRGDPCFAISRSAGSSPRVGSSKIDSTRPVEAVATPIMIIRHISITGLFETFNHSIPLFSKERVTIIHGPNGIGKTSILRLIYAALKPSYSDLYSIPFKEMEISFDGDFALRICPELNPPPDFEKRRDDTAPLRFSRIEHGAVEQTFLRGRSTLSPGAARQIDRSHPFLSRVGVDEWLDLRSEERLTWDEVLERHGADLPRSIRAETTPEWLQELQAEVSIHFIETQRLLEIVPPGRRALGEHQTRTSAVAACSRTFAEQLQKKLAESATLSQSLERTFPSRLISDDEPVHLEEETIRQELAELDSHRKRLGDAGLLDRSLEPSLPSTRFDETTKRVLAVYVNDTRHKLAIFDDFLNRVELMKSIINSRYLYKTLDLTRDEGFVITTRDGRHIELENLSSGEQHELVLLFQLLFIARPNTLIMIDEPELSLHIAWQQQFLQDLMKITELADLRALVATHSPQIIHDHWDLTVELSGTEN